MSKALENVAYKEFLELSKKLVSDKSQLQPKIAQLQFQVDHMKRLLHGSKTI